VWALRGVIIRGEKFTTRVLDPLRILVIYSLIAGL
jgi:hypothetical protein